MNNWEDTLISQYADSPTLYRVLQDFNYDIDPALDFNKFYHEVWNIDTCLTYGLDIWGKVVGVPRVIPLEDPSQYFGFYNGKNEFTPFNVQPFYSNVATVANYRLSDEDYRSLILVKAAANITGCSVPELNLILNKVFSKRGRCYVTDYYNMTIRYTFEFYLAPQEISLLRYSGAMPKPAGVKLFVLQLPPNSSFGFSEAGSGSQPFGQAPFLSSLAGFLTVS